MPSISTRFRVRSLSPTTSWTSAVKMVANLIADQEIISGLAQKMIEAAEVTNDQPTIDLAVRRMEVHQKHAWMLRSHLE